MRDIASVPHHPVSRDGAEHTEGDLMKGMPGLYYSQGGGDRAPYWVGSVLYVDADTAEVRRLYDRQDAAPMPMPETPTRTPRLSFSSLVRRIAGAAT